MFAVIYTIVDVLFFANAASIVRTLARPVLNLFVRRIAFGVMSKGISHTRSPFAKIYEIVCMHLILASLAVRLASGSTTWLDLGVALVTDWVTFYKKSKGASRVCVFSTFSYASADLVKPRSLRLLHGS